MNKIKIEYDQLNKIFHLTNNKISYAFKLMPNNQFAHLYYGNKIPSQTLEHFYYERELPSTVCEYDGNLDYSLSNMPQEFSSFGNSDHSEGSFSLEYPDGSFTSNLEFKDFVIHDTKPQISGMPQSNGAAKTLEIIYIDTRSNVEISNFYAIFENSTIITRWALFKNNGNDLIKIKRAMSAQLDFDTAQFKQLTLDGSWTRERHVNYKDVKVGKNIIESMYGSSGHTHNPFLCILDKDATETSGNVYAMTLVYSRNFLGEVEVTYHNRTRMTLGINPNKFSWNLKPGLEFYTPEAILNYSSCGIEKLSHEFHTFINTNIIKHTGEIKRTKFLTNNWEATYFDFDASKLLEIVSNAAKVGVELFVLDDGWFGMRNDDTTSLGDWFVNQTKLGMSMEELCEEVNKKGLDFGIWIEPEMISKESKLFASNPDYAIGVPNLKRAHGRNQYVLDLTRDDVINEICEMLMNALGNVNLKYIKWDMNRYITDGYSQTLGAEGQGEFYHRQILGVYKMYDRITKMFPNVIIEGCAAGGGRFDLGILSYSPLIWTSDNTDPISRLKIQYGTSILYPLSSMSNHVSSKINHQTGRKTSYKLKGDVAIFGRLGYEVDFSQITNDELEVIQNQMQFYDKYAKEILNGKFYRIESPFTSSNTTFMCKYQDTVIVGMFTELIEANNQVRRIKLRDLDATALYRGNNGVIYSGEELMNLGILISNKIIGNSLSEANQVGESDFSSTILVLEKIID